MNSVKLYIELVQKALNGSITTQEAEALKALDTLIETEDKLDEGVLDLEKYSWAFGPTVTEVLNSVEASNSSMAEVLGNFRPSPDKFMNRTATNPFQVINGVNEKAQVMDAMTLDNPIAKAMEMHEAMGFVPANVQNEAENILSPLMNFLDTTDQVENSLYNIPTNRPYNFTENEWTTLKGYDDFTEVPENEVLDVIMKWAASIGIPIAGGFAGGPAGVLAGAAIAPEMPLEDTIALLPEPVQAGFWSGLPAWAVPLFKKANPSSNIDEALEAAKGKGGAVDLEKWTQAKNAPTIDDYNEIMDPKNKNIMKKFTTWASSWKNPLSKKWLRRLLIPAAIITAAGTMSRLGSGDVADPIMEEGIDGESAYIPPIGDNPAMEDTEQPDTTTLEGLAGLSDIDTSAFDPPDDTPTIESFMNENGPNPWKSGFYIVPDQQELSDGMFEGLDYGGNFYKTPETPFGGDWNPQDYFPMLKPGARVANKLFTKYGDKTWLQLISEASFKYNVPAEIIYGIMYQETGGTMDNNQIVNDTNGYDSVGFGGINMAPDNFGEGGEDDFIWGSISPEQATDPAFAINFIAFELDRYRDYYDGNMAASIIKYRGGIKQGQTYADSGQFFSDLDQDYLTKVYGWATQSGIGEIYTPLIQEAIGKDVKREWDPYVAKEDDVMKGFVDNVFENQYGRKAVQADYDYWLPQILEMDHETYVAKQTALDEGQKYEGQTVLGKLNEGVEGTGEAEYYKEKKDYQTVQDWFTSNMLRGFDV